MNFRPRIGTIGGTNARSFPILIATLICFASITSSIAQGVLAPPPLDFTGLPPSLQTTGTNQPGAMGSLLAAPAAEAPQPPFALGPVQFRPHVLYRFLYGDGIPAAPGQHLKTAINEIYPGILLNLGSHWTLDYTPILRFYSSKSFSDTVDQSVILNAGFTPGNWILGFSQSYASSTQPLIETGGPTLQDTYVTLLNATFHFNTATSLEMSGNQTFVFYGQGAPGQPLDDSATWYTLDWLNYQFATRFSAAVGVGYGYVKMQVGPDMMFEQLQGRVSWRPGEKLTLLITGGGEVRQFLTGGASDLINPLYGLSAEYNLFQTTTLFASGHGTVSPAAFQNQVTETADISGGLRQRLLERLFLELTGGYYRSTYVSSLANVSVNRQDHGTFFNARLGSPILKRGRAAVFYQYSENSSTGSGFSYTSNQVGFELGYRF